MILCIVNSFKNSFDSKNYVFLTFRKYAIKDILKYFIVKYNIKLEIN